MIGIGIANAIGFNRNKGSIRIPTAIKNSMVLWYDIARQKATNESMSLSPILKDLSDNGHDATCYNFAWTEESGISTTNYSNALVSDGVDDYCLVEGLPLLNREDGYTVIVKRTYISKNKGYLASKAQNHITEGAFIFEGGVAPDTFSFGQVNPIKIAEQISYQTSKEYNGVRIRSSSNNDTQKLAIFNGYTNSANAFYSNVALYSFLLFNRDLTTEEIEWVKTNLIETQEEENDTLDESLVDAWIFSGLRNEDAPDSIVGEKGTPLICYNFAWNEEGSGFKDGALYFDAVDDYLSNDIFPILTDFTIICKREIYGMTKWSVVASKSNKKTNESAKGAFEFEWSSIGDSTYPNRARSFNGAICNLNQDDIPELVSWMTKSSYNGIPMSPGSSEDGNVLSIGRLRNENFHCRVSIYWFALYSRSLTKEEINKEIEKLERIYSNKLNS